VPGHSRRFAAPMPGGGNTGVPCAFRSIVTLTHVLDSGYGVSPRAVHRSDGVRSAGSRVVKLLIPGQGGAAGR
jgi:hypothetical protein